MRAKKSVVAALEGGDTKKNERDKKLDLKNALISTLFSIERYFIGVIQNLIKIREQLRRT